MQIKTKFEFGFGVVTKLCVACFVIQGALNLNATAQDTSKKDTLPSIYVLKSVSDNRIKYFNEHKYSILDNVAKANGASEELKEVYFNKASVVLEMLDEFRAIKKMNGMRIYFASHGTKNYETGEGDKANAGRLNLIFTATKNTKDTTDETRIIGRTYRTFQEDKNNENKMVKIYRPEAKKWVRNYQTLKRRMLDTTLTELESTNECYETKYIWFDTTKVRELRDEIAYQLRTNENAGLKIKLVSYTAADSVNGLYGRLVKQNYKQRLTLDFEFTDSTGKEVYMDEETLNKRKIATIINKIGEPFLNDPNWKDVLSAPFTSAKWAKIVEMLSEAKYSELLTKLNKQYTMDTGVPAPPPPGKKNMAKLDVVP